jgi:hypothetical protein
VGQEPAVPAPLVRPAPDTQSSGPYANENLAPPPPPFVAVAPTGKGGLPSSLRLDVDKRQQPDEKGRVAALAPAAAPAPSTRPALAPRNVPPPPLFDGRPSESSGAPPESRQALPSHPQPQRQPPPQAQQQQQPPVQAQQDQAAAARPSEPSRGPPPERLAEPQRQAMEDTQWVYVHGIRWGGSATHPLAPPSPEAICMTWSGVEPLDGPDCVLPSPPVLPSVSQWQVPEAGLRGPWGQQQSLQGGWKAITSLVIPNAVRGQRDHRREGERPGSTKGRVGVSAIYVRVSVSQAHL